MAFIDWSEVYSVGIPILDIQHKKLFDFINELTAALNKRETRETTRRILEELAHYCITHFQSEEYLMKEALYPHLQEHIALHDHFREEIERFRSELDADPDFVTYEVLEMLKTWLVEHILGADQRYTPFIRNYKNQHSKKT